MPAVKIGTKYQVTIPKEVFKKLHLQVGEWVEAIVQQGKIVLIPKQLTARPSIPRLNKEEQKILSKARKKISKIRTNHNRSVGLNNKEIKVAIKAGLVDPDQAWWWHEDWQKGEREADRDISMGRVSKAYDNIKEMVKDLDS